MYNGNELTTKLRPFNWKSSDLRLLADFYFTDNSRNNLLLAP